MKLLDKVKGIKGNAPKGKKNQKKFMLIALILLLIIAGAALALWNANKKKKASASEVSKNNISTVVRGSISNELSSSGTLSPKDTYTITSLVSGEIITADFAEGDQVEKGQVLYTIDQSDIENDIDSADRSLTNAQANYEDAVKDNEEAIAKFNNGTYLSAQSGYIKNLSLKAGDTVGGSNGGSKVAELYDDTQMTVRLPFLNTDADALGVGNDIVVEITDTGEQIPGKIRSKSDLLETVEGGVLVKYVEIYVTNPGGLTSDDRATAFIGDIYSVSDNNFEAIKTLDFKVDLPSSVKVRSVLVHEGQYVSAGTPILTITEDTLEDALKTFSKAVTTAENSLKSAENQLTKLDDTIDKYTITAPISGQVITKSYKAGDKIGSSSGGGSSSTSLALIYDLSELTFEMSIDELDISNVKVGQNVSITADAFENKSYSGYVSNVGLNGTASNGVTTYPVVVTLNEMDGLLPGMNVTGVITLEESEDTLYIPSNALQRGNIVYVKNDSLQEGQESGQSAGFPGMPSGERPSGMPEGMSSGEKPSGMPSGSSSSSGKSGSSSSGSSGKSGSKTGNSSAVSASGVPDGFTAVRVETGIISDDYVEILSGLYEGQEVYVKDAVVSSDSFSMMGGPGGMGGPPSGMSGGSGSRPSGGPSGGMSGSRP